MEQHEDDTEPGHREAQRRTAGAAQQRAPRQHQRGQQQRPGREPLGEFQQIVQRSGEARDHAAFAETREPRADADVFDHRERPQRDQRDEERGRDCHVARGEICEAPCPGRVDDRDRGEEHQRERSLGERRGGEQHGGGEPVCQPAARRRVQRQRGVQEVERAEQQRGEERVDALVAQQRERQQHRQIETGREPAGVAAAEEARTEAPQEPHRERQRDQIRTVLGEVRRAAREAPSGAAISQIASGGLST